MKKTVWDYFFATKSTGRAYNGFRGKKRPTTAAAKIFLSLPRMKQLLFTLSLCLCTALVLSSCDGNKSIDGLAEQVWEYAKSHPDGFTLDLSTMTEPEQGIAVSYAATQGCHSREALTRVIRHAKWHCGYVGGWLDTDSGQYYFDSTRLFPEDRLEAAIAFGRKNGQMAVFILSTGTEISLRPSASPAYAY
jgi:hypothetical protein